MRLASGRKGGSSMQLIITSMQDDEWEAVASIYAQGIATGHATFESDVPEKDSWDAAHLPAGRLVARHGGELVGWSALSPVSSRCVYGGVAEVSVYVHESHRGSGVGKALLEALITESEAANIWTLQSGMFPENLASIRLHESCGFRHVGIRKQIGQLEGRWRDTVLMERRSPVVGV